MKRESVLRCAWALLFCLLAVAVAWAQSEKQPSLADVARQKPGAKAKRVITNDEIPPSPEANNTAPAAASAGSAANASAPGGKAEDGKEGKKEQGQAPTSPEKQTKLQALMKEHQSLETILAQLQQQIQGTDNDNVISTLSGMIQNTKEQLAANQEEIDKLKAGGAAGQEGVSPKATQTPPPQQSPQK